MSKTFVEVAESVGVDEKTIRNVFKDYVALKEREYQFETPKWLGIDEIHIIRRPRLVLTNIERRTIYDIKPNRNKESLWKPIWAKKKDVPLCVKGLSF